MLLSDIETATRQDLFDTGATRWQTADIDRAIDKAVDRYSAISPNVGFADMFTAAYQRTYPYPQSWNTSYPVLWLERILYPLQVYGSYFLPPSAAPTLTARAGVGLGLGQYTYAMTLLTEGGETTPSPTAAVTTTSGNQQVSLSAIQTGGNLPGGGSNQPGAANNVIGRNLYRSQAGGNTLYLLATLQDNTTTTYTDSTPDTSLSAATTPSVNTSGLMLWPPRERQFSDFSGLFDGSIALAGGGNQGSNGAIGSATSQIAANNPSFTLHLMSSELPKDNTMVMRVFYATKHQLDNNGSTIPEIHRDVIVLGAAAYAMEAYQTPTNDNFDYQDGALRDKVDDTKIPANWLATIKQRMARFDARLQEIRRDRDFSQSARAQWGNIPVRWNWL